MKKILLTIVVLLLVIGGGVYLKKTSLGKDDTIYLNAYNNSSFSLLQKLKTFLEQEGKHVVLSKSHSPQSGQYNVYTALNNQKLPQVIDSDAINFLWVDRLENDTNPELLRPFDVIITKNMPPFLYLKAINVRTAYIPEAINLEDMDIRVPNGKAMFFGSSAVPSLSLFLAGNEQLSLDVFGRGFETMWPADEIIGAEPLYSDYTNYSLILVDQDEKDIAEEIMPAQIIKIIEHGGLPFVRYNSAIEKLFGDVVPMYHSPEEFRPMYDALLADVAQVMERKKTLQQLAGGWSSRGQAKKIIELFDVMKRKRL